MKETDRIEGAIQLQSLLQVRDEIAPIICRVSQAEATGEREIKFEAFSDALGKLPFILERLKTTPEFDKVNMKELRKIRELEERALDAYISSCELSMEQLNMPSRFLQSTIILKVSLAQRYWNSSTKEAATFLKK